jgi:hypothetical protein
MLTTKVADAGLGHCKFQQHTQDEGNARTNVEVGIPVLVLVLIVIQADCCVCGQWVIGHHKVSTAQPHVIDFVNNLCDTHVQKEFLE